MSGASPPSSPKKVVAIPHAAFSANVPKNVDAHFKDIESIEIIPEAEALYAASVVKVDRQLLAIGNVMAFFVQPGNDGLFELLELVPTL